MDITTHLSEPELNVCRDVFLGRSLPQKERDMIEQICEDPRLAQICEKHGVNKFVLRMRVSNTSDVMRGLLRIHIAANR